MRTKINKLHIPILLILFCAGFYPSVAMERPKEIDLSSIKPVDILPENFEGVGLTLQNIYEILKIDRSFSKETGFIRTFYNTYNEHEVVYTFSSENLKFLEQLENFYDIYCIDEINKDDVVKVWYYNLKTESGSYLFFLCRQDFNKAYKTLSRNQRGFLGETRKYLQKLNKELPDAGEITEDDLKEKIKHIKHLDKINYEVLNPEIYKKKLKQSNKENKRRSNKKNKEKRKLKKRKSVPANTNKYMIKELKKRQKKRKKNKKSIKHIGLSTIDESSSKKKKMVKKTKSVGTLPNMKKKR